MSTSTVYFSLGDFTFQETEIPESITFGGTQKLAVHCLVGGVRVIDSLGPEEKDLEWSGLSIGSKALDRMLYLDYLRREGKKHTLSWGSQVYGVIIEDFQPKYEFKFKIPYTIKCKVLENRTDPMSTVDNTSIDSVIFKDVDSAGNLVGVIGNSNLTGLFGTFQGAINSVGSFVAAAKSTIATVMAPLQAVQGFVSALQISVGSVMAPIAAIGSLTGIKSINNTIASINTGLGSCSALSNLGQLSGCLGRISGNLGSVTGSASTLNVAGSNLFQVSSQTYGQIQGWTTIAKANDMTDPFINGVKQLNIPKIPDNNDGVLIQ